MKALLFDMDGTLIDSMGMWLSLEKDYMRTLGIDPSQVDTDQIATMSMEETLQFLTEQFQVTTSIEAVEAYIQERLHSFFTKEVQMRPGVSTMIQTFRSLGVPMAVGTATDAYFAEMALRTVGLYDAFDFLQSVSTVGFPKNDQRFFDAAAERFGLPPSEICLFDDALYACVTAKVAGYHVVSLEDPSYEQDLPALRRESNEHLATFVDFDAKSWAKAHGLVG